MEIIIPQAPLGCFERVIKRDDKKFVTQIFDGEEISFSSQLEEGEVDQEERGWKKHGGEQRKEEQDETSESFGER
mgnify:CR=1 FL=1